MTDFLAIQKNCDANSYLLEKAFDEFLMYYAADVAGLEKYMNKRMKPYRKIISRRMKHYEGLLKAQFIATMVFKEGGVLRKLLNHSRVQALTPEELSFLEFQLEHPWRYSFARIEEELGHDFFRMLDTITGETYLLYSPGITRTIHDDGKVVNLWMLLIIFNGRCYQTQGIIASFASFTPSDMLFLATELQPDITEDVQVYEIVERNPFPFMALLQYSDFPPMLYKGDISVFHLADDDMASFSADVFGNDALIQWKENVYSIWIPELSDSAHMVRVYYDESAELLMRMSITRTGWDLTREWLAKYGISVKEKPDFTVSPTMATAVEEITGYEPEINPYERLFEAPATDEDEQHDEEMERVLDILIPKLNAGDPIDFEQIARESNFAIEDLQILVDLVRKKMGK